METAKKWDVDDDGIIDNGGFADQTFDAWTMTGARYHGDSFDDEKTNILFMFFCSNQNLSCADPENFTGWGWGGGFGGLRHIFDLINVNLNFIMLKKFKFLDPHMYVSIVNQENF